MTSLSSLIENEGKRREILNDCVDTLEEEIKKKKGPVGIAIKKGYLAVAFQENGELIPNALNKMLPRLIEKIDKYYQEYQALSDTPRPEFADFLISNEERVTESLLEVTDFRAEKTKRKILAKAYYALRPMAAKQVKQGIPLVGEIVNRHLPHKQAVSNLRSSAE